MILVLGAFDGFHRGHVRLLDRARSMACSMGTDWGVATFSPHPGLVLGTMRSTLFNSGEWELIRCVLGIPHLIVLPFDERLRNLSPRDFWAELKRSADVEGVVVGRDFRFGFEGRGSASLLEAFCREEGAAFFAEDLLEREGGEKISSSAIRGRVRRGDVSGAAADLGYPWFLRTDVRHGDGRGRTMGFPTANLSVEGPRTLPADGVYAAAVIARGQWRCGAFSMGRNPTFDDVRERRAEVFLLDFEGDLYGAELIVFFLERLRPMLRFSDAESLAQQIAADVARCRAVYEERMSADSERFGSFLRCFHG